MEVKPFTWIGYGLLVLLGGFILWMAASFFGLIGSVATAPSRVIQRTLETDNIVASYEWFYDTNGQIEARMGQIVQYKGFLADEQDDAEKRRLRVDLGAVQQSCRDMTNKYNANSGKMNKAIFRGWSLPETFPTSYCE